MYAIKGGWIGQTFALATCNESGGRKARIRRSKEERKAMVESFIKTYQSSNDGKFPSLNLTHKEVGGSFYTVREIVRDIIQENRVLGPAKFSSEKQKLDGNTGKFPLESATMDSQDYLFQLEIENLAVLDQQASAIMEMNVNGNEQYAKDEVVDAGETVESDKLVYVDSLAAESVGNNRELELVGASTDCHGNMSMELEFQGNKQLDKNEDLDVEQLVNVSPVEEYDEVMASTKSSVSDSFVVENEAELGVTDWQENANLELKFSDNEQRTKHESLDFGKYVNDSQVEESDKLDYVESSLIEKHEVVRNPVLVEANTTKLSNPTEDIVVETFPMRFVIEDIYTLDMSFLDSRGLNGKVEKLESKCVNLGNGGVGMEITDTDNFSSQPVVQNAVSDPEASLSNGKPVMGHGSIEIDASNLMEVEDSSISGETAGIGAQDYNKPVKASNLYGAKTSKGSSRMETAEKSVMVGSANEIQKEHQIPEQSKPTLDRINLESWEGKGASKKLSEQERNPLLVFLKSLVAAFMKILSE